MSEQTTGRVQAPPRTHADPQPEFAGGREITDVAKATEIIVGQILRRVESDAAAMALGAERNARVRVYAERQSLAAMRVQLVTRASAVARGFGAVIELLDEADGLLAPLDVIDGGSPAREQPAASSATQRPSPPATQRPTPPAPQPVTVPVEPRPQVMAVTVPEAPQPARVRIAPTPPEAVEPAAPAPRPRRWWHRWTRQAA